MNYLLIAVLLLLAWNLFDGYRKGFMRTVFSLVSWILVLVVINYATPMVTDFLMEETSIAETVSGALEEKINEVIAESGIEGFEENLPEELKAALSGANGGFEEILNADGEVIINSTSIVYTVVWVIAVILVIIVTRIAMLIIDAILGLASKLPIIGSLDKLLGILCGAANGLLTSWIILAIVPMLTIPGINIDFAACIEQSQLLTWMQQNNFILKMFGEGQFFL